MNFLEYKTSFDALMGVKSEPNTHEQALFRRAKIYIEKLSWIPGIEMIAVANSLSMYATHEDSDIDLFIVTKDRYIWLVRLLVTCTFAIHGVWRKGQDIRENFCLSFFIDETALDLRNIAIQDDIYLYYWIYYLKPIYQNIDTYDRFLEANSWVDIDPTEKHKNLAHLLKKKNDNSFILDGVYGLLNTIIRFFGEKRSKASLEKKGKPSGVTITEHILKFHDQDAREEIRDLLKKKEN